MTLIPDDTGGVFEVRLDGKLIWSRAEHHRFPDIKELKQLVRDRWRLSARSAIATQSRRSLDAAASGRSGLARPHDGLSLC